MTEHASRARGIALAQKPHSEMNPYHMAVYLESLVKAAGAIADYHPELEGKDDSGLCGLLTVIEERVKALSLELDAWAFHDGWDALKKAMLRDSKLGLDA